MKHYNIAFVGMGSIGKRHLGNVCRLVNEKGDTCTIDLYRSSMSRDLPLSITSLVANQYLCSDPITKHYDMVFITNPTFMHRQTIERFQGHTDAFFIEKPVFDTAIGDLSAFDDVPSYVACPLRYNPVLQHIKQHISIPDVISVRAISSSYLPDWRPGQDYRQSYSAHSDMGGGVDIDLIHEWDYLTWIFGMPDKCFGIADKYSRLEIDSNDIAVYIARNDRMTFELHLDYFGRKTQRILEIFMHDDTIRCDLIGGTISFLREGRTLSFNSQRNAYQLAEIRHFFDIADGRIPNDSDIIHANNVLKLAQAKI